MTGTSVMNRRHNHHDFSHHDYLGGTGIVKSKTSIAITGSTNRNHHGDLSKSDKRFGRSPKPGVGNSYVVTKSGGSGGPSGGGGGGGHGHGGGGGGANNPQLTGSRKNSRQRHHRPTDTKTGPKTKPTKDDVTIESKNSPIPSILPPISSLQISNSKSGERSPRVLESSISNVPPPPSLSLAPTRLAIRHSTSPDVNNDAAINSVHASSHVLMNNKINNNNINDHTVEAVGHSKNTSSTPTKRSSMSRNDTSSCIRLPPNNNTTNNNNTTTNNTTTNNNTNTNASPPPRSPRFVTEQSRLSPINSLDKPKLKFEKKVMKSLLDNSVPTSPRAYRLGSSDTINNNNNNNITNNNNTSQTKTDGKPTTTQRRQSVKSQSKATPSDEQFSIRRKIEQFRKWHEEQHADNLKRLPTEYSDDVFKPGGGGTTNSRPSIPGLDPLLPTCSADVMDFAKLLEDKIIQNNLADGAKDTGEKDGETKLKEGGDNIETSDKNNNNNSNNNNKKTSNAAPSKGRRVANQNGRSKNRPVSGATWKTWRGINESDAYDDVKKYIDDNDLMDTEREEWIKSWIHDVGKAMSEMGDISIEV